jgi:excisionase family DNA binding protein
MHQEIFDIAGISQYLHLSKSALYKMTSARSIPYIKIQGKLLFRKETIDEWLEQYSQPTAEMITLETLRGFETSK